MDRQAVIQVIYTAFGSNPYPGDHFLQGSYEGSEPFEEAAAFAGKVNWRDIPPEFLDAHYTALSFFSEAGFRYYLPAYLVADVNGKLYTADPVFHLTRGFNNETYKIDINGKEFTVLPDQSTFINPRRYGAMTAYDYARMRLSVFTREEAQAIVAYLHFKLEFGDAPLDVPRIRSALEAFWLDRARAAPTAFDLKRYLDEQASWKQNPS